jgi:hypothetical protein
LLKIAVYRSQSLAIIAGVITFKAVGLRNETKNERRHVWAGRQVGRLLKNKR